MTRTPIGCKAGSLLLLLCACAGGRAAETRLEHDHGNAMVTLSIKPDRITPLADVEIPIYSTVCWLHGVPGSASPLRVVLDRSPGVCGGCTTILGFETVGGRAKPVGTIPPAGLALICFHETGEFRYTIEGLARPLAGVIRVREAQKATKP